MNSYFFNVEGVVNVSGIRGGMGLGSFVAFVAVEHFLISGFNNLGRNAQDVRFRDYGAWMHLNPAP